MPNRATSQCVERGLSNTVTARSSSSEDLDSEGLFLLRTRACRDDRARFRVPRRSILRRKRYAPESGPRLGKLQSGLGLSRTHRPQESHVALLLFLGSVVLKVNATSAGDTR